MKLNCVGLTTWGVTARTAFAELQQEQANAKAKPIDLIFMSSPNKNLILRQQTLTVRLRQLRQGRIAALDGFDALSVFPFTSAPALQAGGRLCHQLNAERRQHLQYCAERWIHVAAERSV